MQLESTFRPDKIAAAVSSQEDSMASMIYFLLNFKLFITFANFIYLRILLSMKIENPSNASGIR